MKIKINKIGIVFGDNDFYNTFIPMLETFGRAYAHNDELPYTREELLFLINQLSYTHYLLFQNQFEYNEEKTGNPCERTINWLRIPDNKLLINEEVDKFIEENQWDNSEYFFLDLTQQEPYVYAI